MPIPRVAFSFRLKANDRLPSFLLGFRFSHSCAPITTRSLFVKLCKNLQSLIEGVISWRFHVTQASVQFKYPEGLDFKFVAVFLLEVDIFDNSGATIFFFKGGVEDGRLHEGVLSAFIVPKRSSVKNEIINQYFMSPQYPRSFHSHKHCHTLSSSSSQILHKIIRAIYIIYIYKLCTITEKLYTHNLISSLPWYSLSSFSCDHGVAATSVHSLPSRAPLVVTSVSRQTLFVFFSLLSGNNNNN